MLNGVVVLLILTASFWNCERSKNLQVLSIQQGSCIKGMSALLLITVHIGNSLQHPGVVYEFMSSIGFLFVAIFFFYSGYGTAKKGLSDSDYFKRKIPKRIIYLIKMMVITETVYLIVELLVLKKQFTWKHILQALLGVKLLNGAMWYIVAMIIILVCYYLIVALFDISNVARDDIGMEISKRTGIPNICHIREFAELDFDCWSYRPQYVKYLNRNTGGFIAISNAVKKYWVEKGLSENKINIVYNGVDKNRIKPADYSTWERDSIIRLVIVGGVIPNKGQWQAIEAICLLPEQIRKYVKLDVIGGITKEYRNKISAPLRRAGIERNVRFLGPCNDVYDRLKNYHIGLMCSKAEGFGRVTVEYMHAGLAVIASNCGANPELIKDNTTGILYDRNRTETLTQAILTLAENRQKMLRIAKEGKAFAENRYTKEQNAKNIYKVYKKYAHDGK